MLKTSFLILSLFLAGCAQSEPPIENLYVVDTIHGVYSHKKIVNKRELKLVHVADLPMSEANGDVCVDYKEYLGFKAWLVEVQKKRKK